MATVDNTIILIGPEGSGKSTIGKLLSEIYNLELYSIDRHRDELYNPLGYSKARAEELDEKEGVWAFYAYWKTFEYPTVCSILQNKDNRFWGRILDFGAGHSVYEDDTQLETVKGLMKPFKHVFLFLPCEENDEALSITEERRGHKLDLNKHFLEHKSNRVLGKHVIYTKDASPEESLKQVLGILKSEGFESLPALADGVVHTELHSQDKTFNEFETDRTPLRLEQPVYQLLAARSVEVGR